MPSKPPRDSRSTTGKRKKQKKTIGKHRRKEALQTPEPIPAPEVYLHQTDNGKGRGAFAARAFRAGDVVEICPVIVLTRPYRSLPRALQTVVFDWGALTRRARGSAVALGHGSLYNHADPANMTTSAWLEGRCLIFSAARDIRRGEELTINYNARGGGHTTSAGNWWFRRLNIEPIE